MIFEIFPWDTPQALYPPTMRPSCLRPAFDTTPKTCVDVERHWMARMDGWTDGWMDGHISKYVM